MKKRKSFLRKHLPVILISIVTTVAMMAALAIYADGLPTDQPEQVENTIHAPDEPEHAIEDDAEETPEALPPTDPTPMVETTESPAPEDMPEATEPPVPTDVPEVTPPPIPTEEPTPEPTPVPSVYLLSITPPDGWYREKALIVVQLIDVYGTGWQSVAMSFNDSDAWYDITHRFAGSEYAEIEITENCTLYIAIVAPDGTVHTVSEEIECIDREPPAVRFWMTEEYLRVEALDTQSGVAMITICGHGFTELKNDVLTIRLRDYAANYKFVDIQAEDHAGNQSVKISFKNPFYDDRMPATTPEPTEQPAPTPKPTRTPRPTLAPTPTATQQPPQPDSGSAAPGNPPASNAQTGRVTQAPTASPDPSGGQLPAETAQPTTLVIEPGTGFSSDGNAVARDLLYDKHTNKQFIRVQTRTGSSYYIIIDYDKPLDTAGESYETYFLNMVDARDLFDLVPEKDLPESYSTPAPTEIPLPTFEPTPTPVPPEPTPEPAPPAQTGGSMGILLVFLLLAGGGALWYFKFRKPKDGAKKKGNYDDFDLEDDDEYEEDEPEEVAGGEGT